MPPKRDAVAEASKTFPADLKRGDLMFAKIFGFPWWPSVVRGCRQAYDAEAPVVRVRFCHTNDNATLPPSGLERFADHPEWANVTAFKFKSPNIRKKWEAALAEAQAYSAAAEESWSDDEEAKLEEMHKKQEESWLDEGHEWLGKRVARPFGKTKVFLGKITKWIPPDPEAGDGPLFHVVHDDGDEEDLEDFEARFLLPAAPCCPPAQPIPEAKRAGGRLISRARRRPPLAAGAGGVQVLRQPA